MKDKILLRLQRYLEKSLDVDKNPFRTKENDGISWSWSIIVFSVIKTIMYLVNYTLPNIAFNYIYLLIY